MAAAIVRRIIPWLLPLAAAMLLILLAVRVQSFVSLASLEAHRDIWPVTWLCKALDVSRSGFHACPRNWQQARANI